MSFKEIFFKEALDNQVNLRTPFKIYDDVSLLLCSLSRCMRKDVVFTDWMDLRSFFLTRSIPFLKLYYDNLTLKRPLKQPIVTEWRGPLQLLYPFTSPGKFQAQALPCQKESRCYFHCLRSQHINVINWVEIISHKKTRG